jgi:hypothetical protein
VVEHSFDPTLDIEQPFGQIVNEHPFECRRRFAVTPLLENVPMAAVIELRTGQALADERAGQPTSARTGGPRLQVIHGGRSPVARRMRRTFLVRRALVAGAAVIAVWLLVQVVAAAFAPIGVDAPAAAAPGAIHLVEQGDTLWALAEAVAPQADPRDVVDQIIELNQGGSAVIPGGQLRAGEEIRLPVGDA